MYCQNCQKKEATIHLTEITDGLRTETHLCEHCAQEEGIAVKSQLSINELLSSLLASQPSDDETFGGTKQDVSCPNCGSTLAKFTKDAVLGCPYDYEVFEKSLAPLIKKAHNGKKTHCGKVPSKTSTGTKKQMELMKLRRKLETAVQNEDYELAAELRDKINQQEK
jgi:protein arginine kinase activator